MQIPLENKLGFYVRIDQGPRKGESIGGGWLAMSSVLPGDNHIAWQNYIETQHPLFGVYAPCGKSPGTINTSGSVFGTLQAMADKLHAAANCSKLRVVLVNNMNISFISVVLELTNLEILHHLN